MNAKNEEIERAKKALQSARYGIAWEGSPKEPVHRKMADGYWVPWHVADLLLGGLRDEMNAKIAVALDDEELAFLRTKLKIGEYDGEDILYAWMAVDELLGLRGKARKDPCCWSQDSEDSDIWASDCGKYFRLDDVDPVAAGFKFCPFCGNPITARHWVRGDDGEDDGPVLSLVDS